MHYLITGGAGFIGSHLAERLVSDGHEVTALDNLSTGSMRNIECVREHPAFHLVHGDVLDTALVASLAERCETVVHLAASVGVRRILADPLNGMRNNIAGTDSVLEAARRFGRKVMVASTSEVYGKSGLPRLCEDCDSVLGPWRYSRWSYATAKKLDEYFAMAYHTQYGLPVIVVRLFNIVGPRQTSAYGAVLPNFLRAAAAGAPIRVFGDGRQTRSFTAVSDCIDAFLKLLDTPSAVGEVFNVGAPNQISIALLAETVKKLVGSGSPIEIVPYEKAYPEGGFEDMRARTPCICKISRFTGWTPRMSLGRIILDAAEEYYPARVAGNSLPENATALA
jgi:UDP-glucose 4-epimerase